MHFCHSKFELQTHKAALAWNLPREITVILKIHCTETIRCSLSRLFAASYLFLFIHLIVFFCGHTDSYKYTQTHNTHKKTSFNIGNARGDGTDIPKTCAVNAPPQQPCEPLWRHQVTDCLEGVLNYPAASTAGWCTLTAVVWVAPWGDTHTDPSSVAECVPLWISAGRACSAVLMDTKKND